MDMERIKRHLDWDEDQNELYSWHIVGSNIHPATLAKKVMRDARALRTALDRVYY
jgi:hypothetical protein